MKETAATENNASDIPKKPALLDGIPRDLLVSLDSLLSWIAHRGWRVDSEEDRRDINERFIPELRRLTKR